MGPTPEHQRACRTYWSRCRAGLRSLAERAAGSGGRAQANGAAASPAAGAPDLPGIAAHAVVGAPALIVVAVAALDLLGGSGMTWLPLLAVGPALAAVTSSPRAVLRIGLLAVALAAVLAARGRASGGEEAIVLSALVAVTLASSLASALRVRRERVLAAVRSVAEAAQHALLKPVPAVVGEFQAAVRYSAAEAEARIGGDLYALLSTPHGVRALVGDVRGKGLPAVGTAALVLGVFREAAYDEPDLLEVVGRIERSLSRNLGSDDFVTAVVVGHPRDGHMEVVNCGHAPPLLVHDGMVAPVEPVDPVPPLGLSGLTGETPSLQVLPFEDGDQLLLYTDGVTEARNHHREFYPLAEGMARHVSDEPSRTVAALHDELQAHVGGRLHDDAALLLLRKPVTADSRPAVEPEAPAASPAGTGAQRTGEALTSARADAAA